MHMKTEVKHSEHQSELALEHNIVKKKNKKTTQQKWLKDRGDLRTEALTETQRWHPANLLGAASR